MTCEESETRDSVTHVQVELSGQLRKAGLFFTMEMGFLDRW